MVLIRGRPEEDVGVPPRAASTPSGGRYRSRRRGLAASSPGRGHYVDCDRCGQLGMFELWLRRIWTGGEPSEAAFKAAATMELKRMAIGVVYKGDEIMERFVEELRKAAA